MPENKEVRKLQLCDIAPYLPFSVQFMPTHYNHEKKAYTLSYVTKIHDSDEVGVNGYTSNYIKLLLRPLDQLTQEITHGQETLLMMDRLFELEWPSKPKGNSPYYYNEVPNFVNVHHYNSAANTKILKNQMLSNPYWMIQELLKYHFDVFNLLSSGLAIPIHNTK